MRALQAGLPEARLIRGRGPLIPACSASLHCGPSQPRDGDAGPAQGGPGQEAVSHVPPQGPGQLQAPETGHGFLTHFSPPTRG